MSKCKNIKLFGIIKNDILLAAWVVAFFIILARMPHRILCLIQFALLSYNSLVYNRTNCKAFFTSELYY